MDNITRIDLVDIELNSGSLHRSWLNHSIGTADEKANAFGIRAYRNGEAVNLDGGSVQGYFRNSQGENIAITSGNTISGNMAYVVLPQACYNYEGQFTLAIKVINDNDDITGTMRIVDGMVDNTHTGSAIAPTESVPTYQEILAVYDQMVAAKAGSVRFDITQSLTAEQKTKARSNIDAASGLTEEYVMDNVNIHRETLALTANTGKAINGSTGAIYDTGDSKYCVSDAINAAAGDRFTMSLTIKWGNAVVGFYDSSNNCLGKILNSEGQSQGSNVWKFTNYEFTAPAGTAKIRFGWHSDYSCSVQKETGTDFDSDRVKNLYEDFNRAVKENSYETDETPPYTLTDGVFVETNGTEHTDAAAGWKASNKIDCLYGDKFVFTGYMMYDQCVVMFYDANDAFIGCIHGNQGTVVTTNVYKFTDYAVTAPDGTAKIRFGCYKSGSYQDFSVVKKSMKLVAGTSGSGKWVGKKWCCVGDSHTEINSTATKRYHDYIKDATGITTVLVANGGTGYKRGTYTSWWQMMDNVPLDSDVITFYGSFNDIGAGYTMGTVTDTGTDTIAGCVNTTFDNLFSRFTLAKIGVISPCPWEQCTPMADHVSPSGRPTDVSTTAIAYCKLLHDICERRGIPFLDLFHCSGLRPWEESFRNAAYTRDNGAGCHPDENGHKLIAPMIESFVESLLIH